MTSCWKLTLVLMGLCFPIFADDASAESDQSSLHTLFGSDHLADNVNAVRRKAASLPVTERYRYLRNWVLPSETHPEIRVVGEFAPTDPSPAAIELEPHRFPSGRGGGLVSPVFDLLETARASGRLDELFEAVNRLPDPPDPQQLRAKRVLQLLTSLEAGGSASRRDDWVSQLYSLTVGSFKEQRDQMETSDLWPDLLLIDRAMNRGKQFQLIGDLLSVLYNERMSVTRSRLVQSHLQACVSRYQAYLANQKTGGTAQAKPLRNWIPVTQTIAMTRGKGYPATRWTFDAEGNLTLASGKNEAYLYFRSPLAGDYEVIGEMADAGISQILAGGRFYGAYGDGKRLISGTFREGGKLLDAEYPVGRHDPTIRYRARLTGGQISMSINGQPCIADPLGETPDPWIGVRSMPTNSALYQQLVISGNPRIPESVELLSSPTLNNWVPYYSHSELVGIPGVHWQVVQNPQSGPQLFARRRHELQGSAQESAIFYHRPLVEDGSVEYEFVYVPGRYEAHPCLDRLVFLLEPSGVRIHWLTDGKFDRTPVTPNHAISEPENQRGPDRLPLKEYAWNQVKLSINGQLVSLELNGQTIYERKLERTNQRTFGFFHYADRNELRVRGALMRGAWPRSLPPYYDQELAAPGLAAIERNRERLTDEFRHDFVRDGLPEDFFELRGANAQQAISARSDGVHVAMETASGWRSAHVVPRFSVSGDFDIQASLEIKDIDTSLEHCFAFLEVRLEDELQHYVRSMTGWDASRERSIRSQVAPLLPDGRRRFQGQTRVDWTQSGRLRIVRIGQRFSVMFAPAESDVFYVIESPLLTAADVDMRGVVLQLAINGRGGGHVIWKDLSIKAERLKYLNPGQQPTRKLFAMSPDGKNLRELTAPKFGLSHLGSPEFSPDGSRLVMDMSQGPTTTSHIVIMNRDGSDMKDLGMGCMPSLSKDGKTIVFSDPRAGIVKMDADGKNRKTIERSGWGVQYSPDGKHIAHGSYSNMTLMDPKTEKKTPLFEGDLANRYSRIYWNFGWSHDSRAIAFKGHVRATGQQELAVVDISKPDKVEILYTGNGIYEDFTFSSDSRSVLFALRQEGPAQPDLYLAHRKTPGQIERLAGQPDDYRILDCDWSPDGKEIVFAALVDPVPVEWPLEENEADR